MTTPTYTAHAHVTGGRDGHARTDDGKLDLPLRMPKELGGDGNGTNPEQLFAVGYAACFATVLTLLSRRARHPVEPVVDADVHLVPTDGGRFHIAVDLHITIDSPTAADLVREAHGICPYSAAVRGNVPVTLTVNGTPLPA